MRCSSDKRRLAGVQQAEELVTSSLKTRTKKCQTFEDRSCVGVAATCLTRWTDATLGGM